MTKHFNIDLSIPEISTNEEEVSATLSEAGFALSRLSMQRCDESLAELARAVDRALNVYEAKK